MTRILPICMKLFPALLLAVAAHAFELPAEFAGHGSAAGLNIRKLMGDEDGEGQAPSSADLTPYATDAVLDDTAYTIGPGDQFQIFIESASLDKQVTAEGKIVLNRIGPIHVDGLTLKEAKERILEKIRSYRIKSQCFVSLSRPKAFTIFVTGAVRIPGSYRVQGNQRVAEALQMAGGYSSLARRGPVRMTTRDGKAVSADLRRFVVDGDISGNPYLLQGAILHVPFLDDSEPIVTVRRDTSEQRLQLEEGETLVRIFQKIDGFQLAPMPKSVVVTEKGGAQRVLGPDSIAGYRPMDGAHIEVRARISEVFVGGAVARPGFQPYRSDLKVQQYLAMAGLLTNSKVPSRIEVLGQDGESRTLSVRDDSLKPGDVLQVSHNMEQKVLMYTPLFVSVASLALTVLSIIQLNELNSR